MPSGEKVHDAIVMAWPRWPPDRVSPRIEIRGLNCAKVGSKPTANQAGLGTHFEHAVRAVKAVRLSGLRTVQPGNFHSRAAGGQLN